MNKKTDACATTRLGLMLRRLGLLPSMIVGLLALPLAAQAASFTGLGDLAGGGFSSAALGVSGDGSGSWNLRQRARGRSLDERRWYGGAWWDPPQRGYWCLGRLASGGGKYRK